jgi:hypothetical protein
LIESDSMPPNVTAAFFAGLCLVACAPSGRIAPAARATIPSLSDTAAARPRPVIQHLDPGALRVQLRLAAKDYFEVELTNASAQELVVLRPGTLDHLVSPAGGAGESYFPPARYRFEARRLGGNRVIRKVYSPNDMWSEHADSENARRRKGTDSAGSSEETIPAKGKLTLTADLPFKLEPGNYELRLSYQYFLPPSELPAHWYSGQASAPPLLITVAPDGDLSLYQGPPESSAPAPAPVELALVRVAPGAYDVRFKNFGDAPRSVALPVAALVGHEFMDEATAPTFEWESVATTTGQIYRETFGERTPLTGQPEALRGSECSRLVRPKRPALVVPARGEASLRVELPASLPNGSFDVRIAYDYFVSDPQAPTAALTGTIVSAPQRITVQR